MTYLSGLHLGRLLLASIFVEKKSLFMLLLFFPNKCMDEYIYVDYIINCIAPV